MDATKIQIFTKLSLQLHYNFCHNGNNFNRITSYINNVAQTNTAHKNSIVIVCVTIAFNIYLNTAIEK